MTLESRPGEQLTRNILGAFLFRGDDVYKPVGVLSGGEKTRLGLCKMLLNPPNFLLMDEPTTHLDIGSIDALVQALEDYEGTLIFISHDVYFIRAIASSVLHISAGQLTPYAGDYQYYLDKSRASSEREALTAGQKLTDSRAGLVVAAVEAPKESVFKSKEQKRAEAEARQARSRLRKEQEEVIAKWEAKVSALENRQKEIVAALENPDTYADGGKAVALNRDLLHVQEELEAVTAKWENVVEDLERLNNTSS